MYLQGNIEARSLHHCFTGLAINITYSESMFISLEIQHGMRMRHLSSVACPALQYCFTLFHKRHDFRRGKVIEHNVFWLSL